MLNIEFFDVGWYSEIFFPTKGSYVLRAEGTTIAY